MNQKNTEIQGVIAYLTDSEQYKTSNELPLL